jgi:hypothetical protein
VVKFVALDDISIATFELHNALREYRKALQTNDNTHAALDEARLYLAKPFERGDP